MNKDDSDSFVIVFFVVNYEKYVKNSEEIDIYNSIQFIEATSSNISQDFNQESLEEKLKMIQSILGDGAIENIRKTFEQLNTPNF